MPSAFREMIDPEGARRNLPRPPSDFVYLQYAPAPGSDLGYFFDERLPCVDRVMEPSTVAAFFQAVSTGTLPTGEILEEDKRLPPECFAEYIVKPYSEWAPGTHDICGGSLLDQVLVRIGSHEDSSRLTLIEKGVKSMKARIWEGLVPISETRWRQKRLDDVANHHLACRYIGQVIEVFSYFQYPLVLQNLTETYRLIHQHFSDFDTVLDALPERQGLPSLGVARLWERFMIAHYTAMTMRAHSWVLAKASSLRERDLEILASVRSNTSAFLDVHRQHIEIGNRIQDATELILRADYTIFVHMPSCDPPANRILPGYEARRVALARDVSRHSRAAIMADVVRRIQSSPGPHSLEDDLVRNSRAQIEAQNVLRLELRGESWQLPPVTWITTLQRVMETSEKKHWGFVVYRLTYGQTDEEWTEFLAKFNEDCNNWGRGAPGVAAIKNKACLKWLDGKDLNIPENDIEAAKKHFSTYTSDYADVGWTSQVFLAVDSASYDSYRYESPFASLLLPGDTGGFVTVVESEFDLNDRGEHADESPLFTGQLRVLGNLLYDDIYPMLASQAQDPEELWPLAMNHPQMVYTGPTVTIQVEHWKKVSKVPLNILDLLKDHIKPADPTSTTT